MKRACLSFVIFLLSVPVFLSAQNISFSDADRENIEDVNFEIIGKFSNKILVYKNIRSNHRITMYDQDMNTIKNVNLDFVPSRTYNIDFVAYADHFYMVYQYQKNSIIHCMAVKMNAEVEKLTTPVEIDSTRIPVMTDNKIYSLIHSEDRQRIMVFKIQTRFQRYDMVTLLFDKDLTLLSKGRLVTDYNERREGYDNFSLANDGSLVFTHERQSGFRDNSSSLELVNKPALLDKFTYETIDLEGKYIDNVKLKIDNLNSRYIINTFYYKKNRGNIEGLFICLWDKTTAKTTISQFAVFADELRDEAKRSGQLRYAFDDFFIRQVIVKRDGGYLLTAEDFTSDTRSSSSSWNRWDYLYSPYYPSSGYNYYNPYTGYYRPLGSYRESTRYYYENILVLSVSREGKIEWSRIIQKDQFDDNTDSFLSFSTMTMSGEIHFLFNNDRKNQIITDQSILPDGSVKRNPTLKSQERGYEFMPGLSKQVGARQLIIPCSRRGNLSFARIDF
ncbi:MAG TPA: hypothetical protein DCQ97_02715 [Chitinophagaceae bacterium]|nr:hypothetical protein [Chitinophagaceae bacterium]